MNKVLDSVGDEMRRDRRPQITRRIEQVAPDQSVDGRAAEGKSASYAELYDWLEPDELLVAPPQSWTKAWHEASPDRFGLGSTVTATKHRKQ